MRTPRSRARCPPPLLALALLGAWEAYVDSRGVEAEVLPAPHAVASALWDNGGLLWHNFAVTAEEVVLGLALALLVRLRAGRRDPPLAAAAPRRLPAGRRLAGGADRR